MKELNKKLAEWAGFVEADIKKHYYWETGGERVAKWRRPDTDYSYHVRLPDFTDSLDDCFKWLVPKGNLFQIIFTDPSGNNQLPRCDIRPLGGEDIYEFGETFAIALCKAMEKLIGEKDA